MTLLQLRGFGAAFGDNVVLHDVALDLPVRGLTSLVGPAGSGKSTLLRSLAGLNDPHPSFGWWGEAIFDGVSLGDRPPARPGEQRPGVGLVTQHARFFLDSVRENLVSALPDRASLPAPAQTALVRAHLERNGLRPLVDRLEADVASLPKHLQRQLAIVRVLVREPALLLVDEPTAGLDDSDAVGVLALLRMQAFFRSVLFVTHHQRHARAAGGTIVLLAGGRVREVAPARRFFDAPATLHGEHFVRTGGSPAPSPSARSEDLDAPADVAPVVPPSRFEGPRGFFWVLPGLLGGVPRPGIVAEVDEDLEGLRRLGVRLLVTLEETATVPSERLSAHGLRSLHVPIPDMDAPAHAEAAALCAAIETSVRRGEPVAVHCRAGLGRTGTVLAAHLVYRGLPAREAIEQVRGLNPRCIQSAVQIDFLSSFEGFQRSRRGLEPVTPDPVSKEIPTE